jgi:MarR family transcriptional regulator, 2-MHQ and catechol-resistance regulon repressor
MDARTNRKSSRKPKIAAGLQRVGSYETQGFYTHQVALLHRLIARSTKQAFDRMFGITQMEWRILIQLEHRSPSKISELHERTFMQKPQISLALPNLIRKGYVVRADDPDDARAPYFAITEKGLALYREVLRVTKKRQKGLESLLSAAERKAFESAFKRLIDFYMEENRQGGEAMFDE